MSENGPARTSPPPGTPEISIDPTPPKRKKRWWLRIVIALPILVIVLILMAPTLLSLPPCRAMLAPTLRTSFTPNGKLEIGSWSFGWFGGQRLEGITLLDDQNAAVAHLNVKTDASLLSLIRGRYSLGDTTVDGDFDARIDPVTGRVNLLHIAGVDPKPADTGVKSPDGSPAKPPTSPATKQEPQSAAKKKEPLPIDFAKVKGKVSVNLTGTISASNGDARAIPMTKLQTGNLVVDLNDLEHGVGVDGTLKLTVNDRPATLTIKGTADAIQNNVLIDDPNQLGANLTASIEQLDLTVVNAALAAAGINDVDVSGLLKGKLVIDIKPGGEGSIRSEDALGIDNLSVKAPQLQGDTFTSKRVDFPINISRAAGSDEVKIDSLGAKTDLATFAVAGIISQKALQNLSAKEMKAPGAVSTVTIKADVPSFAAVAAMLPNSAHVKQGVQINGGGFSQTTTINIVPDGVKANESLVVSINGISNGKSIALEKTSFDATADVAIKDGQTFDTAALLAAFRSLDLNLVAPFATIRGGGVPEKLQLAGNVDLTRFYDDLSQFVDMGNVDLKGKTDFTLATNGLPKEGADAFGAKLGFNATGLTVSNAGTNYLDNENVKGDVDALSKQQSDSTTVTFRKLNIGTDSGLFGLWTAGDNAWVTLRAGVPIAGDGEFHVRGKLERLVAPFASAVDPSMQLKRGQLDSTLTFAFDQAKAEYKITNDTQLTKLDVGTLLNNETLKLGTTMFVPMDRSSAKTWFEVASSFVSAKGDADVLLLKPDRAKPAIFEMARSAEFDGSVPSLAKLYALANSMNPMPAKTAAGVAVVPPLKVNGGSIDFSGKATRDDAKGVTSVTFNVPGVRDLSLSRGDATFKQAEPITLSLAADVTTDSSKANVMDQLTRIVVSKLDANMPGIAHITMPDAIELTNLSQPTPSAKGTIHADGNLQPLGEMLAVVNGSNPLPVAGTFATDEKVSTNGESISLVGTGKLDAIKPLVQDAKPLPDTLTTVQLTNDLSADLKAKSATINTFSLVAPRAKDVLALKASGTIRDLGTKNSFDGLSVKIAYDLPNLWPLAQPFVDPTGQSIGKVENLAGKYEKTFKFAGSYPTVDASGKPVLFNNSVRTLDVTGDLQIDSASLVDKGVDVAHLAIPIVLKNGVAKIANADGSLPPDFDINNGKGKIGGIAVDLTAGEPTISKLDKLQVVTNATLNPIMSNALGKFFNPVFPNATKARALVTVVLSADHLKLGKSLTTKDSGNAVVVLSLTEMEISNPLGEQLLGGLVNKASGALKLGGGLDTSDFSNFRGELKNATYTLAGGIVTQKATFMIGSVDDSSDPKAKASQLYPFTFGGDVNLSSLAMNLDAGVPMQLVKSKAKGDVAKILAYVPDQLQIGFTGTTTKPKLDFKDAGREFSDAFVKFGTARLTGGKVGDSKNDSKSDKTADKIDDIIGLLGGSKEKSDEKRGVDETKRANDVPTTEPADEGKKKKKK